MDSVLLGGEGRASDAGAPRASVAFCGDAACIAEARRLAAGFLDRVRAGHGLPVSDRAMDLTQLVVSELVTNARKYAAGPILMDLLVAGDAVDIAVWDSDPVLPAARPADPDRVGQHGLEIVLAVVRDFQVRPEPMGKRVIARVALHDGPGGDASAVRP